MVDQFEKLVAMLEVRVKRQREALAASEAQLEAARRMVAQVDIETVKGVKPSGKL